MIPFHPRELFAVFVGSGINFILPGYRQLQKAKKEDRN